MNTKISFSEKTSKLWIVIFWWFIYCQLLKRKTSRVFSSSFLSVKIFFFYYYFVIRKKRLIRLIVEVASRIRNKESKMKKKSSFSGFDNQSETRHLESALYLKGKNKLNCWQYKWQTFFLTCCKMQSAGRVSEFHFFVVVNNLLIIQIFQITQLQFIQIFSQIANRG